MLFLAECIYIFTTWQAIPFKRKFYFPLCSFNATLQYTYVSCVESFITIDKQLQKRGCDFPLAGYASLGPSHF